MSALASEQRSSSNAAPALLSSSRSAPIPSPVGKRLAWLGTARFRLTAWYVGGLTAILAILGTATYVNLDAELLRDSDAKLAIAASETIGQLQARSASVTVNQSLTNIVLRAPQSVPSAPSTRADTIYLRLLDPQTGATVAASPDLRAFPRLLASLPNPSPIRRPATEYTFGGFSEETQMRVMTMPVAGSPDLLQLAVSWDSSEDFLTDLTLAICCACLLLLGLSAVGCWLLVGHALAPIDEIVSEAEQLSLDGGRPPVLAPRTQTDAESRHLVDALNALLARLHNAISIQRQFSADASHELRTPLTILRGELELSLTRPRVEHEYKRVLASCLEETTRMIRIVQDLSLLARNDNLNAEDSKLQWFDRAAGSDSETVDVVRVCDEIIEMVRPIADARGVSVAIHHEAQLCLAKCREDSFRRAMTNLLDNTLAYSRQGDAAVISIRSNSKGVTIELADTGVGISESDLPHVFERFYRADKARVNTGGSGLGLSIVKSIAEAHGGSVSISSRLGAGTTVILVLPCA